MILLDIVEAGMLLLMVVVAVLFIGWLGYSLLGLLGVFEWWGVLVAIAFIYPRHPTIRWWHSQHDTSSDRTPLSHMLPRVIGG